MGGSGAARLISALNCLLEKSCKNQVKSGEIGFEEVGAGAPAGLHGALRSSWGAPVELRECCFAPGALPRSSDELHGANTELRGAPGSSVELRRSSAGLLNCFLEKSDKIWQNLVNSPVSIFTKMNDKMSANIVSNILT